MSGLLGEALLKKTPAHLDAVFFCNSGTEAVEGALKFARAATGRPRIVSLKGSYHGLSYGALVDHRQRFVPGRLRAVPRRHGDGRSSATCKHARSHPGDGRRGGVHRRADPGQGGQLSGGRLFPESPGALPPVRHAAHLRRGADRARAHGQMVGLPALGPGTGHRHDGQDAQRRLRAVRGDCHAPLDLPADVQPAGPLRGAFEHVRAQQPRHDLRAGDADRPRRREAHRKLRRHGRVAPDPPPRAQEASILSSRKCAARDS